ncbi:MAG: hypothetical protein H0W06_00965, partial [Chloroflexia bacterium]|nr:hypothetical protein [Chloroflexia bacterium]
MEGPHPPASPPPDLPRLGRGGASAPPIPLSHGWERGGAQRRGEGSLIGESLPRPDALGKVTGATDYPADRIEAGMLHLKVVFAGRPHARILAIDASAALASPGVVAVLTAADVPFNAFGLIEADQPVLCAVGDTVRFEGDKVAVVVAESTIATEHGALHVDVTYDELPAVVDPEAALGEGAPLVHAEHGTNLLLHV